jgi:predicted transcriptional regulator YdeE
LGNEIYAVYHQYEGDHIKPFSYFIGCKVNTGTNIPEGMDSLIIPGGIFNLVTSKGKMPDCINDAWKEIWDSDIDRAYDTDFEVYGDKSRDWNNAEIEIFISINARLS